MNSTSTVHADYSPRQKAAHLALLFANGQEYTVSQVAEMFGMTVVGAHGMLGRMSGAIPLETDADEMTIRRDSSGRFDPRPGRWRRFDND